MTDGKKAKDWKIFLGDGSRHNGLLGLPAAPPWRFSSRAGTPSKPPVNGLDKESDRAKPFIPSESMILAVNAALYLRRPLLITGRPGTGKSTLIAKVADELMMGPVLRWPITSRSSVRNGVYEYDAVGRLQAGVDLPVEQYLTLGPLGTALKGATWPRPLLIDEIDKSDLDFANDLLNVIEEGEYEIPELRRLGKKEVEVRDSYGDLVTVQEGRIVCNHFPFVVMTSNAEREFPPPFLRRCVRLNIDPPTPSELAAIIQSHLHLHQNEMNLKKVADLIEKFDNKRKENQEVSTDQLLNAVFLTVSVTGEGQRSFSEKEIDALQQSLLRQLSGSGA
jgi:MoxR-like ATPase